MPNSFEHEVSDWQVKAACLELLAFSYRYPVRELADALVSGEWVEAAMELAPFCGYDTSDISFEALESYRDASSEDVLHRIRAEATRLFLGVPVSIISPYEGVWRAQDDGVAPLLFVNPHTMEVERFMQSCGLGQPKGTNEPLDNIATELELLQYLCALEAGMIELPESKESSSFPGGSPDAAYRSFVCEHMQVWVPRFAEAVLAHTKEPFFQVAALLLKAQFVE